MDLTARSPRVPDSSSEFEAEWWVVVVCAAALVCSALTSARLLQHGTSSTPGTFPSTASRLLLCSQAAAGILQVTVSSPVLLLALTNCYEGQVSEWACSVGWVAWGWAWGVQVLGVLAISYERVRMMSKPPQGSIAPRTAILVAGAAWLCGGVVGVTMGKGLQCSLVSRGHPGLAVVVLVGALLPVLLLGGLWAHGIKGRRASTCVQTGGGSTFCVTSTNASRWRLTTPQPSHNLEAIMFTVSQWAAPLFAGSAPSPPASGSAPSLTLHPEAMMEGSRSPSPVYSRRCSMLEEDTFTHGGVYIGSLQSHIRAHSGLCSDQNVRSQGCQTGEEEVSPPVVEWRVLPPTPTAQDVPPFSAPSAEMADIGVQCCADLEAACPSPAASRMALAGEMEELVVHQNSSQVVVEGAAPAFLLSLVQALMGVPLPLIGLALQLMDTGPVWAWRVTLTAVALTSLSPAIAHGAYLWAAASSSPMPSDI